MKMTLRHWLVFLSCCTLMSCSLGLGVNSYGVFLTPVSEALGVGRGSIALNATLSGLTVGFLCPTIVKHLQKGAFRLILGACILCNVASYFLMAFANRVWMFNLLGILRGAGSAGFYLATCTMILGNWFRKNLGTVTGIAVGFSGLSGAILSPLLTYIILQFGYKTAYLFSAAFVAVLSLPPLLVLTLHPEDCGLKPYGADTNETPSAQNASLPVGRMVHPFSYRSPLFLLFFGIAVSTTTVVGFNSHLSGYAQSIGATAATGAAMMSAAMISNIIAKTSFGIMSDHISPKLVYIIMVCINASGLLILLLAGPTPWLLILGSFLFGAIFSVTTMGLASLVRDLYGNRQYGQVYSLGTSLGSISNAISIALIGFSFDLTGSFFGALTFGVVLGGSILLMFTTICKLGDRNRTLEDL